MNKELEKDYDYEGNWEYCYQDNETGRRFNFADENCERDFLILVNSVINNLKNENVQLRKDNKEYIRGLNLRKAESQSWAIDVHELREQNCKLERNCKQLKTIIEDFVKISEENGAISPMRVKSIICMYKELGIDVQIK